MSFHGMSASFRMSSMIFYSMGTIFRENSMNKRTLNRFSCRMLVGTRWEEVQQVSRLAIALECSW